MPDVGIFILALYIYYEISLLGLDSFRKNWFMENANYDGDFSVSLEVENIIHRERSKYQDILIFDW